MSLGVLYTSGELGEIDYVKALEWYTKAAEQGDGEAQFRLGLLYGSEVLGEPDYVKALGWYTKAAEQGNAGAQCNLGYLYESGNLGEKDYSKAFEWYQKAAEQDHVKGEFNVGRCYEYGMGVEKNYVKALEWYQKAAIQGHAGAMYFLGEFYENGTGVEKNIEMAYQWYKKSADADSPNPNSCYKIAEAYYAQMDPQSASRTGILLAASVLIPVTNIVTVPAAILGSVLSKSNKTKKFLKTDAGKDMMKYYRRAAALGHLGAQEKVKKLEADE